MYLYFVFAGMFNSCLFFVQLHDSHLICDLLRNVIMVLYRQLILMVVHGNLLRELIPCYRYNVFSVIE